jgi:purine-binding chemotaxis protein CheW
MDDNIKTSDGQFLTFRLAEEIYALDITKIREVLEFDKVTKVPKTPKFLRGVINLRGKVVPVIDLRLKFGMSKTEKTVDTCVIITEIDIDNEMTQIGAMADSVSEVIDIEPENIESAPKIGTQLDTQFIDGMGKHNEDFVIILNINNVFSKEEISVVMDATNTEPKKK